MSGHADFSIVTVTYAGDVARFENLCRSIDATMPDVTHHVLVDRVDLPVFSRFVSPRRNIVCTEDVLTRFRFTPFRGKRFWIGPMGPPVRPWIFQQLVKLAFTSSLPDKCAVLTDSDAVFVRPIDPASLFSDGRVKLYHAPGAAQGAEHSKWHDAAAKALKLPRKGYSGSDYISTAIPWSPAVVRALLADIDAKHWRPWTSVLAWNYRFSEYILYGRFATEVAGTHRDQIFLSEDEICHCSWHFDLADPAQVDAFVADLRPTHSAVLIQSNLKLDPDTTERIMRRFPVNGPSAVKEASC